MRTQALHIGGILEIGLEQVEQEWRVDALSIEWIERCALARCRVVRIPKPFGIEGDTFPAIIDRRQYHAWLGWRDDIDEDPPAIAGHIRTIGFQKAVLTVRQTRHAAHRDRPHFFECAIAKIAMEGCHRHCVRPLAPINLAGHYTRCSANKQGASSEEAKQHDLTYRCSLV